MPRCTVADGPRQPTKPPSAQRMRADDHLPRIDQVNAERKRQLIHRRPPNPFAYLSLKAPNRSLLVVLTKFAISLSLGVS